MAVFAPGGEEVVVGSVARAKCGAAVTAQHLEQARREHRVTVLGSLALLDADESAFGIDIGKLEGDGFAEGSRGVTSSAKGLFAAAHRKKIWHEKLRATHRQLMAMPAHFRYLVVPEEGFNNLSAALNDIGLFSEDGIGRLGIITIKQNGNSTPQPAIAVVPERFRVDDAKVRRIEMKLLTISPDIAVRV